MLGSQQLSMLYIAFPESCITLKHKHKATTGQSLVCCCVQSFEKQGRKADDAVQYFLNPETDPFGRQLSAASSEACSTHRPRAALVRLLNAACGACFTLDL